MNQFVLGASAVLNGAQMNGRQDQYHDNDEQVGMYFGVIFSKDWQNSFSHIPFSRKNS